MSEKQVLSVKCVERQGFVWGKYRRVFGEDSLILDVCSAVVILNVIVRIVVTR